MAVFTRTLAIILACLAFEFPLLWFGTWGIHFADNYSSMISFTFLLEIASFCFYEREKTKGKHLPRYLVDTAFVAFAICIVSIPFVSIFSRGVSVGFMTATIADTSFKGMFGLNRLSK
jgi:hypothetical protein